MVLEILFMLGATAELAAFRHARLSYMWYDLHVAFFNHPSCIYECSEYEAARGVAAPQ